MNTNYLFSVQDWNGKFFARKCDLNQAFVDGLINREVTPSGSYGSYYTFSTKEGVRICSFYKDDTFGFCSQAYGIEVPNPVFMFPEVKRKHNEWLISHNLSPIT